MTRALAVPAALALLFLALIGVGALPTPRAGIVPVPRAAHRAPPPPAPVAGPDGRDVATILARPLFSATRRPPSDAVAAGPSAALPRLSAILVARGIRTAVFEAGPKPVALGVGGRTGPYTVRAIMPTTVTVLTADGSRVLHPAPLPTGTTEADAGASAPAASGAVAGTSLLDQLQRGALPHYAVPPPPTLQGLLQRMRGRRG